MSRQNKTAPRAGARKGGNQNQHQAKPTYNLKLVRGKRNEVRRRYNWQAKQNALPIPRDRRLAWLRVAELERLFASRWGATLPNDDAGNDDLDIALSHIVLAGGDTLSKMLGFMAHWAPWLPKAKARHRAKRIIANPMRFTADQLAWRMRLDLIEREYLSITTIGAYDCPKQVRERLRRLKWNQKRRKQTRADFLAKSKSKGAKPWKAEGISKAKWYGRQKKG